MPASAPDRLEESTLGPAGGGATRALVVDDEPNIRHTLALCLRQMGCEVAEAPTGGAALDELRRRPYDLALLDLRLEAEDGIEVLPRLLALRPELDVVVITAYSTIDSAVEAMRRGAKDYVPKPFTPAQIRDLVERTRERRRLEQRVAHVEVERRAPVAASALATASPRMRSALDMVRRAAAHDVPVLLRGEPGTGKTGLARALHDQSARRARPFGVVSCRAASDERLTIELFGRGGGAEADGRGVLERASGGTVLLDETGELSPALQARLLRLIQERRFERVGQTLARTCDVRIVVATDRDLEADVTTGRLQRDLLYRLNVMEIVVPPLRERPEDVVPLARELLADFASSAGRPVPTLSRAAEEVLLRWSWPGNVRELRNVVERALILAPGDVIEPEVFPGRMLGPSSTGEVVPGGDFTAEEIEREHVLRVVARTPTLTEASRILGVDVTTLWRKRKKWGR
ncbi:sigma-54-dependent transcriptional regulator [Anaeromyxobacter oryzae]|uniref:Alginate biosynthesis transcriptional regulatory protein AlgB n=1 Tax=Anaeromyxobacter oryzae TaxID=2918170 RepID=A0ABM7WYI8_9BACT|nr:sigma-54 dependent transcriptional regulator [Anaeromyxobacter oryzae]BDG04562.1 alginate biosynthesis transcriptional regulatory protein AlgB [Anaeromyxobacter oryzae]